ncbi:ribosomal protein L38e [Russula emetica]|nr:ribosomal protein L38e [Russula emetica]
MVFAFKTPKEIRDIKQFIDIARRNDARFLTSIYTAARIKKIAPATPEKAEKLKQSLPPGLAIEEVKKQTKKK